MTLFPCWKNPGQGKRSGVIAHTIHLHHDHDADNTRALALARARDAHHSDFLLRLEHKNSKSKFGFGKWKAIRAAKQDRALLASQMATIRRAADRRRQP
jgi:hypothetical protein